MILGKINNIENTTWNKLIFTISFFLILFFPERNLAQTTSDGQIWLDTELNYTYKLRHLFQDEISYQTLVSGETRWQSINMTPVYEYNVNSYLDLVSGIPLSYTIQDKAMSTFEVRTMVGARIYFTPYKRYQTRLLSRWEYRWSYDHESDSWETGNRFRFRGEFLYPINRPSFYSDNMWYTITDAEVFFSSGGDISERFANRTRLRAGIGYRLNYKLRFEAIYTCQISRNTINDNFDAISNILRLRFKYYFK